MINNNHKEFFVVINIQSRGKVLLDIGDITYVNLLTRNLEFEYNMK